MNSSKSDLERLVLSVQKSGKYRHVYRELIARIGQAELEKRSSLKAAIKATKNKLHQVGGVYLGEKAQYTHWLAMLRQAKSEGENTFREACRQIMEYHTSTRERVPFLQSFYSSILAELPPVQSVADIACGFHPLAIPWMSLARGATYFAYDIFEDLTEFLNAFFSLTSIEGQAQTCDVLYSPPTPSVDLAYLLKAIPCLEQLERTAGKTLLSQIAARHLVVSFPIHSLGGRRDKGMLSYYEKHFKSLVANTPWTIKRRFLFTNELVFLLQRS